MPHFHSENPTQIPLGAIRAVGDALVKMGYASSFGIDEKSKRYDFVWTETGKKFASEFAEIYFTSFNAAYVDFGVDGPPISEAIAEIFTGATVF